MMQLLQDTRTFFETIGAPCPVQNIAINNGWVSFELNQKLVRAASARAQHARVNGWLWLEGTVAHEAVFDYPDFFYHGTTPECAMSILLQGFLASHHKPNGVYSYGDHATSLGSMYCYQGAQIKSASVAIGLSKKVSKTSMVVPEGGIMRMGRSVYKKKKAVGWEWVHHPSNIELKEINVREELIGRFLTPPALPAQPQMPHAVMEDLASVGPRWLGACIANVTAIR